MATNRGSDQHHHRPEVGEIMSERWATSNRNPGDFSSECRATIPRNRGRHNPGIRKRLGVCGEVLFLVTVGCIAIKLWLLLLLHDPYPWLTVTLGLSAAMLPAISAAFLGVRFYAELEILATRSARMHAVMQRAEARLTRLRMDRPLASQALGAEVLHLAEQMLLDLKGWAELFHVKIIEPG